MSCVAVPSHDRRATVPRAAAFVRWLCLTILLLALPGMSGCNSAPRPAAEPTGAASIGSPAAPLPSDALAAGTPLPAKDPDWLARVQQVIAEREYQASENGEGLQAPNRRHNLRTYFEASGIRVHDRTAAESPELLGLSLTGFGRGEVLPPVGAGEVASEGTRVEIRRPGLVEWYENSPAGLEQGFTFLERPDGEGPLALELAVHHARASLRGEGVILATAVGRRLSYAKLAAVDAEGRELQAHLEVPDAGQLRIVLEDGGAVYPVTIDPLMSATADAKIESDQSSAVLGASVSGAGDVNDDGYDDVIVGAPFYDAGQTFEGAAFVFLGGDEGIADGSPATADAQLEPDQASAWMGFSVSGAGDVNNDGYDDVIVGAERYDVDVLKDVLNNLCVAVADPFQCCTGPEIGNCNGNDLCIAEGDPFECCTGPETGACEANVLCVAEGDPFACCSGPETGTCDANALCVDENNLFACCTGPVEDLCIEKGNPYQCCTGDQSGTCEVNDLVNDLVNDFVSDFMNDSCVAEDDPYACCTGNQTGVCGKVSDACFAFVNPFACCSGPGTGNCKTNNLCVTAGDPFQCCTGLRAGACNIASDFCVAAGDPFECCTGSGTATCHVNDLCVAAGDPYGCCTGPRAGVCSDANDLCIAAGDPSACCTGPQAGICSNANDLCVTAGDPFECCTGDQTGSCEGEGTCGDDVDGFCVASRNPYECCTGDELGSCGSGNDVGVAFVFLGGDEGIAGCEGTPTPRCSPTEAAAQLESHQGAAWMGTSVSGAGDVNDDGYDDVIVGAEQYDKGQRNEGAAFVFLGGDEGIAGCIATSPPRCDPLDAAAQIESNQENAILGSSVSGAGDVNDDGYADVIVGAHLYDLGQADEGAAFVFLGGDEGIAGCVGTSPTRCNPSHAAARLESDQADAWMGSSVSEAGDVDDDGYADVIVGAYHYDVNVVNDLCVAVDDPYGCCTGDQTGNCNVDDLVNDFCVAAGDPYGCCTGDQTGNCTEGNDLCIALLIPYGCCTGPQTGFCSNLNDLCVAAGDPFECCTGNKMGYCNVNDLCLDEDDPYPCCTDLEEGTCSDVDDLCVADGDPFECCTGPETGACVFGNGGAAFVFLGGSSGISDCNAPPRCKPSDAAARIESSQVSEWMGFSVSGAGDVNGDVFADVIVGAYHHAAGEHNEGAAFVFLGESAPGGVPEPGSTLGLAAGLALLALLDRRRRRGKP